MFHKIFFITMVIMVFVFSAAIGSMAGAFISSDGFRNWRLTTPAGRFGRKSTRIRRSWTNGRVYA